MRHPWLCGRLGLGLLGLLLACGCRSSSRCCPVCDLLPPAETGTAAATAGGAPALWQTANQPATSYLPSPPAGAPAMSPQAQLASGGPSRRLPALSVSLQTASRASVIAAAVPAAHERPARPRFAHDPSYRWLTGTLAYSRADGAWLLRYASVEEDDRYGGVVTLTDFGRAALKDGQTVQVEGRVIDPESRQLRPAFEVKALAPSGP